MLALVHGLEDMQRAVSLYERSSDGAIYWATEPIAAYLVTSDPARSAELYFGCAEHEIARSGRRAAQRLVDLFGKARNALASIGKDDLWRERLARFIKTHARQRTAIAALCKAYPIE